MGVAPTLLEVGVACPLFIMDVNMYVRIRVHMYVA